MKVNPEVVSKTPTELGMELIEEVKEGYKKISSLWWDLEDKIKKIEQVMQPDPVIKFGKYEGTPLSKLPKIYIAWLFSSGELDRWERRDLKDHLRSIIKEEGE